MAKCEIKFNIGDQTITFNSNRELDEYLWDHKNTLLYNEGVSDPQAFYDLSTKSESELKLKEMYDFSNGFLKSIKEQWDSKIKLPKAYSGELAVSIGLSRLYERVGNAKDMAQPVSEGESILTEDQRDARMKTGTDIHSIIEATVNGGSPDIKVLSDSFVKSANKQIADAIAAIKEKHTVNGKAPSLRAEVPIVSKEVDGAFMDLIHQQTNLGTSWAIGDITDVVRLNGRADLIVIDDNGDVFVYDFKNTEYPLIIGSKTNASNEIKLASYSAMSTQWGLPVKGMGFVEFSIGYGPDKVTPTTFNFRKITPLGVNDNVNAANTYFPSGISESPVKDMNEVADIVKEIVPDSTIMQQKQLVQLTVDSIQDSVFPIPADSPIKKRYPNAEHSYYMPMNKKPRDLNKGWVYGNYLVANSKEEMKERLEEYVMLANQMGQEVLPQYADAIKTAIRTKNLGDFRSAIRSLSPFNFTTIYTQLQRYITGRWTLLDDETLIQNGIFIFQKPNSGRIEIVTLDTHKLDIPLEFKTANGNNIDKKKTTILGNFLQDYQVDTMFFLKGEVGSAVLMKIMAYLSLNADKFGNNSISSIKAVSTCDSYVAEASNTELISTWDRLCVEADKKLKVKWNHIPDKLIMSDVRAGIEIAHDILNSSNDESIRQFLNYKAFKSIRPDGDYPIQELEKRLQTLRRAYPDIKPERITAENEIQMAMLALQRGVLAYYMFYPKTERDVGTYVDRSLALEGTNASSAQESKSIIERQLQAIISNFHDVYKKRYEEYVGEWQIAYKEFKEEVGLSYVLADDFKYFREHWFIKDGDKIHPSLRLLSETDPYWSTVGPKEKKLYDLYVKMWERMRYNNNDEAIVRAKSSGSFYEIPLVRTNFKKQLEAGGIWDGIKGWVKRTKQELAGSLFGLEDSMFEEEERTDINHIKLPSYIRDLVDRKRTEAIKNNGVSYYETNMDIVFLTAAAVGMRREYSEHAMMLINALRANSYYGQFVSGRTMSNILKSIDKQINAKMYHRSVIDPKERGIALLINYVKGITSTTTLMLNWKSFTRETLRGITDAFARTKWDEMYGNKFTVKEYMDALETVATSAHQNIDVTSYIMQLSHRYGMANFSGNQIVEASQTNPNGLYEIGSDALFITATWPDFIHRTAMLIAHLKHEGVWDAYSLNDKGILQYDMTKDKRFETYLKYKDDTTKIPNDQVWEQFNKEFTLYKELLKDFENAGEFKEDKSHYEEGDLLPDALSPRTQNNLKVVADRLYGNYDKETKSLMQEELLGALFFQFRTFPLERLAQWFKSPTHVNDINYEQVYDADGDPLVLVIGEDGHTITHMKYKDIDPEWISTGRAWYYKILNGHEVEGHFQRVFAAGSYLLNHNQQEFDALWKSNPYFRGQIALALYDTLFGVLLAFLIKMLFGEETIQNMNNEEWYTRWLYAVGTGMTQDGPVWSLLSGIVGNGAPPSLSILRTYMTNATSVITGDTSIIYGIANTLGMTREFTSILTDN